MATERSAAVAEGATTVGGGSQATGPVSGAVPEEPAVAIVTITLNDPVGVRRTVESVRRQDFARHEHVIVDGGSGPDVTDWLRRWQREDPGRRHVVVDAPAGIYPAMNQGIRRTSAPLVLILNGGDQLLPGALARVTEHHARHGWRWAYGGSEGRDMEDRTIGHYAFAPFSRTLFRAGMKVVPHPAAYVTRELYEQLGLYREDLGTAADQEFFLRAAAVSRPVPIPGTLAAFEVSGVSSKEGLLGRELSWHRMRLVSGAAFGGHRSVDGLVTACLVVRQLVRWAAARSRRSRGGA
jgi:glycosyltransferase involved in cell wall biosynthesis